MMLKLFVLAGLLVSSPLLVKGQNLLMVIAGSGPDTPPADVEFINLTSTTGAPCQVKPADYPLRIEGAVSTVIANTPIVCSGGRRVQVIPDCYKYDVSTDTWITDYQMNYGRDYAAGVMLDEKTWWITGGYNPQDPDGTGNNFLKETEIFSYEGLTEAPSLPVERERHAVVKLNDSAYILTGGRGADLDGSRTWLFNPNNDAGEEFTELPQALVNRDGEYSGVVVRSDGRKEVVVAGGAGQFSSEIFNPETVSWRPGPSLPVALGAGASVQQGDTFLVIGGIDQTDQILWDRIYRFVPRGELEFDYFEELSVRLENARRFHTAVLLPDDYVDCGN